MKIIPVPHRPPYQGPPHENRHLDSRQELPVSRPAPPCYAQLLLRRITPDDPVSAQIPTLSFPRAPGQADLARRLHRELFLEESYYNSSLFVRLATIAV